jgi:hypothetical protein
MAIHSSSLAWRGLSCGVSHTRSQCAAVRADAARVQGLSAFCVLRWQVMLEQHERGPPRGGEGIIAGRVASTGTSQ